MDTQTLYEEIKNAGRDQDTVSEVAEKIIHKVFEDDSIGKTYRTENPDLNVGEEIVKPSKFMVDGVRVQNSGLRSAFKVNIKASYYDKAVKTETLVSPGLDFSAGAYGNGQPITVGVTIIATVVPDTMSADVIVMFTEGYN